MKSEQRHELQQNSLARWLNDAGEWCRVNAPLLVGVVVGAALVIIGVTYFRHQSEARTTDEWTQFFAAAQRDDTVKLQSLGTKFAGDTPGQLAKLLLADTALNSGVELMSSDREEAEKKLNDAKNLYAEVRSAASEPLLKQRAVFGLARYYESVGLLEESTKEYQTIVKDWPDGPFTEIAKRKIEYLQFPSTVAFAKWYREHKPLPPAPAGTAGTPKLGEFDKLPTDESSFPAKK
jgi:hypothetical protein